MIKAGIDQDAIARMFSEATAKQADTLRKGVGEATLKALQGRYSTMENIKKVLAAITLAATAGAGKNASSPPDIEKLLRSAVAGMNAALLKAVEANRTALQQFVDQGASLQEKQLKGVLANLEKKESPFLATVAKVVEQVGGDALQAHWAQMLSGIRTKGSDAGALASQTVQDLLSQAQGALRGGRASGTKATQAILDGYAALTRGVLIGMSEGMQGTVSSGRTSKPKSAGRH